MAESIKGLKRTAYCGEFRAEHAGQEAVVFGWVQRQRDLGQLIFIDLRDRTGIVQLAFDENTPRDVFDKAFTARSEYVLAARSIGAKPGWIIRKHILPNCLSVIIVSTALQIPSAIFTESYLSFIGLGVNAPMPSLGSLANSARQGLQTYPYKLIFPALMICLIVLSLNLLGDGLRDAFDPKLKR